MSARSALELEVAEIFPAERHDRRLFAELPFRLATSWPAWQPGLRKLHEDLIHPGRNPFWRRRRGSFFVALREGRAVGRLALVDPGGLPERPRDAVLAFPDFVDDEDVVGALFEAVQARAQERGAHGLVGPLNPNIHHDVGIQISGHERRNAVLMSYQPPYYQGHFEARGFERLAEFEAWALGREAFFAQERLARLARRVARHPALRIRPAQLARFSSELPVFFQLYCGAFAGHWGFEAPSWDEFRFIASDLRHVLRANMALIAEWNQEPVGFVLGIPDLYQVLPKATRGRLTPRFLVELGWNWRRLDQVRVMIAGVLPAYRRHGIHLALFERVAREIFALGYAGGEIGWVLADNRAMQEALQLLGAQRTKSYRLYAKRLHQ